MNSLQTGTPSKRSGDWRWLIVLVVLCYALLVSGFAIFSGTAQPLLQGLGVPALKYPLMDLRGVAVWCDAWSQGKDPSVFATWITLPGEEKHPNFLMNYSPVVLGLSQLGLTENSVVGWGIFLALLYGTALWFLCDPCTKGESLIWILFICSPSSVLVVERGNLDMLVFGLLVLALIFREKPLFQSVFILGAGVVKFFPIAALVAPWRELNWKSRILLLPSLILFVLFLLLIHSRLTSIAGSLQGQYQSAFGYSVTAEILLHHGIRSGFVARHISSLFSYIALIAIIGSGILGLLLKSNNHAPDVTERSLHAFFLTAPMMLGLFVLGPQMDYKWIFFLFMLPLVLEISKSSFEFEFIAAKMWIVMTPLYSYWTFFSDEGSLRNSLLKQLLMWGVMFLSAFLVGRVWNRRGLS